MGGCWREDQWARALRRGMLLPGRPPAKCQASQTTPPCRCQQHHNTYLNQIAVDVAGYRCEAHAHGRHRHGVLKLEVHLQGQSEEKWGFRVSV